MVTLYGIRNCDTVKRARAWLGERGVACRFHDYKVDGIDTVPLDEWIERLGWERLLNCAGTTFRKLPEAERSPLDAARVSALMRAHPSSIRRPVLAEGETLLVGFAADAYALALLPIQER